MAEIANKIWTQVYDNFEILYTKWNLAMQNHAKNGEKNVYAIELLTYVLYGYVVLGILLATFSTLMYFGKIDPFKVENPHAAKVESAEDSDSKKKDKKKKKKIRMFTKDMVAQHNKANDCWLIVNNKVYDVSKYVEEHPGGEAILKNAGKDSTVGFNGPQHPGRVHDEIEEYFIGNLIEDKKGL